MLFLNDLGFRYKLPYVTILSFKELYGLDSVVKVEFFYPEFKRSFYRSSQKSLLKFGNILLQVTLHSVSLEIVMTMNI